MFNVLVVDDDVRNLSLIEGYLNEEQYVVTSMSDSRKALELLQKSPHEYHVVLLDRMMPDLDGMKFINFMKQDKVLKHVPVIMQTAANERERILEGLNAGVYYYLTKPFDEAILSSIVYTAAERYTDYLKFLEKYRQKEDCNLLIKEVKAEIRNLQECKDLTSFLSSFYPQPERVIVGISEILLNSLEHGNLGITYEEKTKLHEEGIWEKEVNRRLALPENKDKKIAIEYTRTADKISLHVKDEGKGFDWKSFLIFEPMRLSDSHGRGVAISKAISFDEIKYLGRGNEVICTVYI